MRSVSGTKLIHSNISSFCATNRVFSCHSLIDSLLHHVPVTCIIMSNYQRLSLKHLLLPRDDLSLVGYGGRCFALVRALSALRCQIREYLAAVLQCNPQRVTFHTYDVVDPKMTVVEMAYVSRDQQSYFTFVVWHFLHHKLSDLTVHLWDTLEHDVFRRDFEAPLYMDAELSANRLWIVDGKIVLLHKGYSTENPHGEYVQELSLGEALDELEMGRFWPQELLTNSVDDFCRSKNAQAHFTVLVLDVENVPLPQSLVEPLREHPEWLEGSILQDLDLSKVELGQSFGDGQWAEYHRVAVAQASFNVPSLSTTSLQLNHLVALAVMLHAQKSSGEFISIDSSTNSLLSQEALDQLSTLGFLRLQTMAQAVHGVAEPIPPNWKSLINQVPSKEELLQLSLEEETFSELSSKEPTQVEDEWEDSEDFVRQFKQLPMIRDLEKALGQEPSGLPATTHDTLSKAQVEATLKLDGFDDFVEFYAKQYLAMSDETLKKHRVDKDPWSQYNDDSDYESS